MLATIAPGGPPIPPSNAPKNPPRAPPTAMNAALPGGSPNTKISISNPTKSPMKGINDIPSMILFLAAFCVAPVNASADIFFVFALNIPVAGSTSLPLGLTL